MSALEGVWYNQYADAPALLAIAGGVTTDIGGPMCADDITPDAKLEHERVLSRERSRRYRLRHLELERERDRTYHAANKEREQAYKHAHREQLREYQAAYYQRNRERKLKQCADHYAANRDLYAARVRNYQARKKNAPGSHTRADVAEQRRRQAGLCFWCGEKVGRHYHVDHVVPLSRGGSNGPENLVIACASCNLKKNNRHPMDFAGVMF